MAKEDKIKLVTGTIGDDIHSFGIKVIEHALTDAGFRVIPLGVQTSQEDFIAAAVETNAAAILVSSMSGHARLLCEGLREKCTEAGLKDILLYLGGTLSTGDMSWQDIEKMFLNMGYTRVYSTGAMPGQIMEDLKSDLAARK
ncbi:MAG TPA: methylaspartate mutase subunit S [Syntrophorhabdaceae bacterium]|nr:methylaspartate mutase subunit S [Syntrophorhabdaceae bacterium]